MRLDTIVTGRGRRFPLIGLLRVPLVRFVAANEAPGYCAYLAVASHVARDPSNDRTFDAAFRLGGGSKSYAQNRGQENHLLHGGLQKKPVAATIRVR